MEKLNEANILSNLPLMFEKNIGQHNEKVQFMLNQKGYTTFFADKEVVLAFRSNKSIQELKKINNHILIDRKLNKLKEYDTSILRINYVGSNKIPQIIGENEFNCKLNYFKSDDRTKWKSYIPLYEKLLYKDIYPGIDVLYSGIQGRLEVKFIIAPNSNIEDIILNFEGNDKLSIDKEGNLQVIINNKILKILKPKFSESNGIVSEVIEGNFVIDDNGKVSFNVFNYSLDNFLEIRLLLFYGAFKEKNAVDKGCSITVDENKCAYITGLTAIQSFPDKNIYQDTTLLSTYSAYLIKVDTTKKGQAALMYSSYLGGNGFDEGVAIKVDCDKVAYIVGVTNSFRGFPVTEKAYLTKYPGGGSTGFLLKIDTTKVGINSLVYGTYLGGNCCDYIYSIDLDKNKNVYMVGSTNSNKYFPITENAYEIYNDKSENYGFLLKFDITKKREESLLYGTYFGGSSDDIFLSVAVDYNNYIYVTGLTESIDFPTTQNSYKASVSGKINNSFLCKFDISKSGKESLIYSSYLGGNGIDAGYVVAVDYNQCAYIAGITSSYEGFPITEDALQSNIPDLDVAGFLIKINTKLTGSAGLIYGTYLGGTGITVCSDLKIDYNGYVYLVGFTTAKDFPVTIQCENKELFEGEYYSFLVKVNPNKEGKDGLIYSSYLYGNGYDFALAMSVDKELNAYITGYTELVSDLENDLNDMYKENSIILTKIDTRISNMLVEKSSYNYVDDSGEKIRYTIRVINNGPDIVTNVMVIDKLQKGVAVKQLNSLRGAIHQIGDKIIWKINYLKPYEELVATIIIRGGIKDKIDKYEIEVKTNDNIYYY